MKNIPPLALPKFHGISTEDHDAFCFEFDVLCRIYDYYSNAQMLKLFPTTLRDSTLRWFMGLDSNSITVLDEMKNIFLKKYQDYYKTRDFRK